MHCPTPCLVLLCAFVLSLPAHPAEPRLISGELIAVDAVNRRGTLRPDRTDAQRRGDWDLPHDFALMPEGSIRYHGAPAALRDVPIGTHLHGQFLESAKPAPDPKAKPDPDARRVSADSKFDRVLVLEDDFSHDARADRGWRVESVDLTLGVLTVMGSTRGKADVKPTALQIGPQTRIWMGRARGALADLKPGQTPVINLTYCTLKGPGRCVDIWIDKEARELAAMLQVEEHRRFIREHGLPGIIDEVNNAEGSMSVALFDGFDAALLDEFPKNADVAAAAKAPPFVPGPGLVDPMAITAAVAEENLRTWDQINDRKGGALIEIVRGAPSPGRSGVRVRFKLSLLIEGFRPGRIVRVWPARWKVDDLPREERLYQ